MAEQRYQAVMAVMGDGLSISQVAEKVGVSRQTLLAWLGRYEAEGLEGLVDRSTHAAGGSVAPPAAWAVDFVNAVGGNGDTAQAGLHSVLAGDGRRTDRLRHGRLPR